jgi:hypothetical protein
VNDLERFLAPCCAGYRSGDNRPCPHWDCDGRVDIAIELFAAVSVDTDVRAGKVRMSDRPPIRWGILGCAPIVRRGLVPGILASQCLTKHLPAADRLEGIAEVFDPRRAAIVGPEDRHDVEPAALIEQSVSAHELQRRHG